jgi:pSer/pThr/pTyr-binding forkhead associated (FHA) protein
MASYISPGNRWQVNCTLFTGGVCMAGVLGKQPAPQNQKGASITENPKDIALQVQWGPVAGKRFRVAVGQSVRVGRSVLCDIPFLHDAYISRTHFSLDWEDNACWIHDLSSRHGTFLNGKKVDKAALSDGDTIRVGWTTIVVQSQAASTDKADTIQAQGTPAHDISMPSPEPATAEDPRPDCLAGQAMSKRRNT